MKKLLLIFLIFSIFNNHVNAQEAEGERYPDFTFGLEWGYIGTFYCMTHYNFFAPEGFRVDEKAEWTGYISNADMYMHFGWNLSPVWNLSLYIGYAGIGEFHDSIPVSIRGTRYFGQDMMEDRWFAFVDAGSGLCLKTPLQEIFSGKIGGGYQLSLSRDTKLNFMLSFRTTYTHPVIHYENNRIQMSQTNRNNALTGALSIGMGLAF